MRTSIARICLSTIFLSVVYLFYACTKRLKNCWLFLLHRHCVMGKLHNWSESPSVFCISLHSA